ncbi:DSD1 family PLP-dependent enzyme [Rouxiella badensis]|uniref:DSD1 family PLP-dependent enzyme n=1 Tax=Rouxiella badensis TaxID=1646377 RepID=UPI0013EEFE4C|nr:DSD1 family PLP-dependent enzyme [Rouxiella badensis]QII38036.1 DSD1 family PLP-dependent enzyme [Rouxiella badensis]
MTDNTPLNGVSIHDKETPFLLLNRDKLERNVARLREHTDSFGVPLRPHLKTVKSVEAARLILTEGNGPATVSTLKEAEVFAAAGCKNLIYAVGIAPQKLARVVALLKDGTDISVILDSLEQARAVADYSRQASIAIPALIEIDSDGHRSGVAPGDNLLIEIGRILHHDGAELRGIITHAGESYHCKSQEEHQAMAEKERAAAVACADALRHAGLPSPVVSVGSTPTAHFSKDLTGVTEVRAGVFTLFDLVMTGAGVCQTSDIALSVVATVIGHQREKGWIMIDAGWMAMSRDRGTAAQAVDQRYGIVCDMAGNPLGDLLMVDANQEHGIVALRPGSQQTLPYLPYGSRVRILPNHACATVSQHGEFAVIRDGSEHIEALWPIIHGW